MEVTLITARSPADLRTLVGGIAGHLDLVHLRKISALSLASSLDRLAAGPGGFGTLGEEAASGGEGEGHVTLESAHVTMSDLGTY